MKHEVTEVTEPVSLMAKYFSSSEPPASPSLPTSCNTRARPPQLSWGTCGSGPTAQVVGLLLHPCQERPPCPILTHPSKKKKNTQPWRPPSHVRTQGVNSAASASPQGLLTGWGQPLSGTWAHQPPPSTIFDRKVQIWGGDPGRSQLGLGKSCCIPFWKPVEKEASRGGR